MSNTSKDISCQLEIIREAYNRTVDDYNNGIDEIDPLPENFRNSEEFRKFREAGHKNNSGEPDIKEFLSPSPGMSYLDAGSCANLIGYKLYMWPSKYFGIDISEKLIGVCRHHISKKKISIGGLYVSDAADLPFAKDFFNIAAVIGVLEYYDLNYIRRALKELCRVLKPSGRIVLDMPNREHSDFNTMIKLENYLGRPRFNLPSRSEFEQELLKLYSIVKIDDSNLMIKYFTTVK